MLQEMCDFELFIFSGATMQQVRARFEGVDLTAKLQEMLGKEAHIDNLNSEVQRLRRMHCARA